MENELLQWEVPLDYRGRIDKFLVKCYPELSRSRIQKNIQEGAVFLKNVPCKSSEELRGGEMLSVKKEAFLPSQFRPEAMALDLLYEDEYLMVVHKPAGMLVHPAGGVLSGTLVNGLMAYDEAFDEMMDEELRPGIVHRLDKDTSGCLLVAKTSDVQALLKQMFQEHRVHKIYLALVVGALEPRTGHIELPIGRNPRNKAQMCVSLQNGKPSHTQYRTEFVGDKLSLVRIRLHTGRTHQIRVHFSYMGHPVAGDTVYGKSAVFPDIPRQMLHSYQLSFVHPVTQKKIHVRAPLPEDFLAVADAYSIEIKC